MEWRRRPHALRRLSGSESHGVCRIRCLEKWPPDFNREAHRRLHRLGRQLIIQRCGEPVRERGADRVSSQQRVVPPVRPTLLFLPRRQRLRCPHCAAPAGPMECKPCRPESEARHRRIPADRRTGELYHPCNQARLVHIRRRPVADSTGSLEVARFPVPPRPRPPPSTTKCVVAHALARRAWGFARGVHATRGSRCVVCAYACCMASWHSCKRTLGRARFTVHTCRVHEWCQSLSHFRYWQPLVFDDTVQPPLPAPLLWVDSFEVNA